MELKCSVVDVKTRRYLIYSLDATRIFFHSMLLTNNTHVRIDDILNTIKAGEYFRVGDYVVTCVTEERLG